MVEASQASGGYGEGSAMTCGLDDSLATLVGFALLLFAGALAGIVCLFVFFSECATTTAFVAMTLVLCVAVCATQLALSESGDLGAELVPTKDGDDDEETAKSELGPAPMDCLD